MKSRHRKTTPRTARRTKRGRNGRSGGLDRGSWIAAARAALIERGIAAVRISELGEKLQVTRESFYHHFRDLAELHSELLTEWEKGNTAAYTSLLEPDHDGVKEFKSLGRMWLGEKNYSPAWDLAVRDWGRVSLAAAKVVARVDRHRMQILEQMFLHLGYGEAESIIRARVTYFHQVGYYTIGLKESPEERQRMHPAYVELLMGPRIAS
jgi:AcrR family transcriptional regulator